MDQASIDRHINFGLGQESVFEIENLRDRYPLPQDGRLFNNVEEAERAGYGPEWMQEFRDRVREQVLNPDYQFLVQVAGKLTRGVVDLMVEDDIASATQQQLAAIQKVKQRAMMRERAASEQSRALKEALEKRKKLQDEVNTHTRTIQSIAQNMDLIAQLRKDLAGRPQQQRFAMGLMETMQKTEAHLVKLDRRMAASAAAGASAAGAAGASGAAGAAGPSSSVVRRKPILPTTLYSLAAETSAQFAGPLIEYLRHPETTALFRDLAEFAALTQNTLLESLPKELTVRMRTPDAAQLSQFRVLSESLADKAVLARLHAGRVQSMERTRMRSLIDYYMDPTSGLLSAVVAWAEQTNIKGGSRQAQTLRDSLKRLLEVVNANRTQRGLSTLSNITPSMALDYPEAYARHEAVIRRTARAVAAEMAQATETRYVKLDMRLHKTLAEMWFDLMGRAHEQKLLPTDMKAERTNWRNDRQAASTAADKVTVDKLYWRTLREMQRDMLNALEPNHPLRKLSSFGTNPDDNPLFDIWRDYAKSVLLPAAERKLRKQDERVASLNQLRAEEMQRISTQNLDQDLERTLNPIRNTASWAIRAFNSGMVRVQNFVTSAMNDALQGLMVVKLFARFVENHRHLEEKGGAMEDDARVQQGGLEALVMHSLTRDRHTRAPFAALVAYCIQLNEQDHPSTYTRAQVPDGLQNKKAEMIETLVDNYEPEWDARTRLFRFTPTSLEERSRRKEERRYQFRRTNNSARGCSYLWDANHMLRIPGIKPTH